MPRGTRTTSRSILIVLLLGLLAGTANAAPPPKQILFPVLGPVSYTNDFGAPRTGHSHQGNDLMAPRRAPVVAVETGRVVRPSWSSSDCALILTGASGTEYWYLHLNNDLTSRNDNRARNCSAAFAPGFRSGMRVQAGQLIGFVGDSGNASGGSPHLHFELHPDGNRAVSPYPWLQRAPRLLYAVAPGVRSVRLSLQGTVRGVDSGSLALDVARAAVSGGWSGPSMVRHVTLGFAPGVVIERVTASGAFALAAPGSATPGERATVWTTWFRPSLATQLAGGIALSAAQVRLHGPVRRG
jgi:Peptidase family M23